MDRGLLGDLEVCLKMYKKGEAGTSYKECQYLATKILNKIYKMRFKIADRFDPQGAHENEWKNLEYQIETKATVQT